MMLNKYLLKFSLYAALVLTTNLQANDQVKYADFISALENLSDQELREIIVKEANEYLHRFPKAPNLHEMHFKIATIFHDEQDNLKSFYTNMEIIYLYPGT